MAWMGGVLVVAVLLLAGCAGEPTTGSGIQSSSAAPPTVSSDGGATGSIAGTVVDDEAVPLAGVRLSLVEADLRAETDGTGAFSFTGLEAATYTLAAEKLGYQSAAKRVDVTLDAPAEVRFVMEPIPVPREARQSNYITDAFIHLMVSVPGTSPRPNATSADYRDIYIQVAPDVVSSVVGMTWQSSGQSAKYVWLDLWVAEKSCASGTLCTRLNRTLGKSPLVTRSDAFQEHAEDKKSLQVNPALGTISCWTSSAPTDVGACQRHPDGLVQVTVEQRFRLYTSVFFVEPAPPNFNPVPS